MKYLVVKYTKGNHGHQIKDTLGGMVIAKMFGFTQVFPPYPYLRFFGFHCGELRRAPRHLPRRVIRHTVWKGMSWEDVHALFDPIADEHIVRLYEGTRVHPCQAALWFQEGRLERDIFSEIVEATSAKFMAMHGDKPLRWDPDRINVAIHACFVPGGNGPRHDTIRYIFPMSYYTAIVDQLRQQLQDPMFHVFCEARDGKRVRARFGPDPDVRVHVGPNRGARQKHGRVHQIFLHFVRSDILVTCNSGFSVVATYFRYGKPTIYHPHTHLHSLPAGRCYIPTEEDGRFDSTALDLHHDA